MLGELTRRTAKAIEDLPANFMLDAATYEYGNELGFDGLDFYVCGRGGALGTVVDGVVSAAFIFFNPRMIHERWERGAKVMPPTDAAIEFAGCLHRWAERHLSRDRSLDYAQLADLLGQIVESANPAGAPLFAGWRSLPLPEDSPALVLHHLNGLRELRGAMHGASMLAAGIDPLVALLIRTPFMAGIFGWQKPYPEVGLAREAWAEAERATDRAMGHVLGGLDDREHEHLAKLLEQVHAGVH